MKKTLLLSAMFGLAVLFGVTGLQAQVTGSIKVYASAPTTATETYSGAQIETFESFAAGAFTSLSSSATNPNYFSSATYTSGGNSGTLPSIKANDLFGASTGSGRYLNVTPGNTVTLTLGTAVPYFGIALSAVDAGNVFTFMDAGGNTIATFNANVIRTLLPNTAGSTVKAINGTTYNTQAYYGQPGNTDPNNNNNVEIYSYLHFFTTGALIKSIVFSQAATSGNFENDNHSILATAPAVDGTFIVVPEPGIGAMVAAGCAGVFVLRRLRRARR